MNLTQKIAIGFYDFRDVRHNAECYLGKVSDSFSIPDGFKFIATLSERQRRTVDIYHEDGISTLREFEAAVKLENNNGKQEA